MSGRVNQVFICSSGHSGSTLLDMLLGSHSKMTSLGEILHLSKNISLNTRCACGESVRSCPVWMKVVTRLSDELGVDIFHHPYRLHLGYPNPQVIKDTLHESLSYQVKRRLLKGLRYAELAYDLRFLAPFLGSIRTGIVNTFRVYDAVREVENSNVVVDSTKSYLEGVGIYQGRPTTTRILLLTRDGRGVFYSYLKRGFPRKDCLNSWKKHYARALPLLERHIRPDHLLQVKYEHLVRDPEAEMKRICAFLEISFEPGMLRFADHVHHITNGNDMRFSRSSRIQQDNAWRRRLVHADLAFFEAGGGDLNRRLGYE